MNVPLIEKLIQRQINQWNSYKKLLVGKQSDGAIQPRPIVTISRQLGSGGRRLAETLAEHFSLQVHGQDIIDHIARDKNLERRIVEQLDEQKRSQIDLWIRGVFDQRIFLRDEFHSALIKTIRTLAAHGGVVIIGRGGNFILSDICTVRLRLVASLRSRITNLMAIRNLSREDAALLVESSDTGRAGFIEKLYHADIADPCHYDLVVNTDSISTEQVMTFVTSILNKEGFAGVGDERQTVLRARSGGAN